MLNYQQQNSEQTLAEGLREYATVYQDLLNHRATSEAATEFFRCHDTVHVVFGCDVSLADEGIVKISSFFGTTEGLGVMRGYRLEESKEIYETLPVGDIITTACTAIVWVPRTLWRCMRMQQRWPWDDFDAQLEQPLADIRQHFGITVAHSRSLSGS